MNTTLAIFIVIALIIAFVAFGFVSSTTGITCQDSRYFFVLGGMILGYVIAKLQSAKK